MSALLPDRLDEIASRLSGSDARDVAFAAAKLRQTDALLAQMESVLSAIPVLGVIPVEAAQ